MAVPDWPTTFGMNMFLYDFWNAPFGVRVEHTHRLYGAAVGLATIVLAGWFLAFEPRRWMKVLGVVALARGHRPGSPGRDSGDPGLDVPGGRPRLHGPGVLRPDGRPLRLHRPGLARPATARRPTRTTLRRLAAVDAGPGLRPDRAGGLAAALRRPSTALAVHAAGRGRRLVLCRSCVVRSRRAAQGRTAALGPLGSAAWRSAATLQVVLGTGRFVLLLPLDGLPHAVGFYQAVVRTGHQTNAALLFAAAIVLTLRFLSSLSGPAARPSSAARDANPSGPGRAARTGGRRLKTVASLGQPVLAVPEPTPLLAAAGGQARRVPLADQAAAGADGPGDGRRRLPARRPRRGAPGRPWRSRCSGRPWWPAAPGAEPVARAGARRADAADGQPGPAQRPASSAEAAVFGIGPGLLGTG